MVKVVSEKPIRPRKVVCSRCSYELEYTGEDVQSRSYTAMGETDVEFYIVCPRESCKSKVSVRGWNNGI